LEQLRELIWIAGAAVGECLVPAIRCVEIPLGHEEVDEPLRIVGGQRQIELMLVDRFDQQLVGISDYVGLDFAQPHAPVRQWPPSPTFVIEIRRVGFVQKDLKRDAELLAVVQYARVRVRDPPRADIQVKPLVKGADLALSIELGVLGTAPDGPVDPADPVARLEHAKVVAKLTELVGDDETGDAGAEDDNFGFCRTSGERRSLSSLAGHQVPGVHRGHHQR
jgi:hypothetical protein